MGCEVFEVTVFSLIDSYHLSCRRLKAVVKLLFVGLSSRCRMKLNHICLEQQRTENLEVAVTKWNLFLPAQNALTA